MAALAQAFDPNAVEPDTGRPDPFPAGRVRFMVMNTDVKPTKSGNGSFLWMELEVQGGANDKRKWWDQITLANPNPQAVEIGQRQLSALCHSVGYLQALQNSDVLHGRTGEADVDVEPAGIANGKSFPAKNVTKRYIVPGSEDAKAAPAASNAAPAQSAQLKKKPWEK